MQQFKRCICACSHVETVLEVSGTYDLIIQGQASSLEDYTKQMQRIAPQLAEYVSKIETSFVARKIVREVIEQCLWIPCANGRRRISISMINKILAEGDYMRLCMDDGECLIHDSIRHLMTQLDREQFIQLHRSAVVRADYIDRLLHRDRRWVARLRDGSQQTVAKSHVAEVLKLISPSSATPQVRSAMPNQTS